MTVSKIKSFREIKTLSATFWKNAFIFYYSHMVTNFKFRLFIHHFPYKNQHMCLNAHQKASF